MKTKLLICVSMVLIGIVSGCSKPTPEVTVPTSDQALAPATAKSNDGKSAQEGERALEAGRGFDRQPPQ